MCDCYKKESLTIKIKKIDSNLPELEKLEIGNWIDLKVSSVLEVKNKVKIPWSFDGINDRSYLYLDKNKHYYCKLGFAAQLPEGYEAYILPRSSTFKSWGMLLANGKGIIDNSYSGENDEWIASMYSTRGTCIYQYDRIVQFRIQKIMPKINIEYVDCLTNPDRNGFGSTGKS